MYNFVEGLVSGVYTLWTTGQLPREHLDHPCTRVPYWFEHESKKAKMDNDNDDNDDDGTLLFSSNQKEEVNAVKQIPDWSTPETMVWRSAYKDVATDNKEPLCTFKTEHFAGCLDYLFINQCFRVKSFLEMPWQNNLKCRDDTQEELQHFLDFPSMPNDVFPSDHLPLVVDLYFVPKDV
ncbi:CCR4-NOT transcription complex, subunit 6-like protein [Reticulomyxa filosa]|uniref:CCR4-NOT transcription complex, subunit 6-like protein n=1 Tax=Reticulomyxa filosa TaxID=46433 RepID=X6N2D5_RETFI|nr:CCR4-NOT transcription complex, subunit 6-like protein [Reticulomyxa filosa]|eukprot:ETO20073.1 CCR4-NOT transcription complex, subunit 6-like protein [Reticulomyxa filosa]